MVQPLCDPRHFLCLLLTGDFFLFFFFLCQLEAYKDFGLLILNWLESGEASTSVLCQRRPIVSQRVNSRKDIAGSPSRLSADSFSFCFSLISSQSAIRQDFWDVPGSSRKSVLLEQVPQSAARMLVFFIPRLQVELPALKKAFSLSAPS